MPQTLLFGRVRTYDETKGYGFIERFDNAGRDYFLHASMLSKFGIAKISKGARVAFDYIETAKGLAVTHIELLPA